jgi:hypothetical protein
MTEALRAELGKILLMRFAELRRSVAEEEFVAGARRQKH